MINAKNEYALKSSVAQLSGSISGKIKNLREGILYEIAYIESALDDPEHISLDGYGDTLKKKITVMIEKVQNMLDSSDYGRIVSEGIRTVIVGKPNVGKSSLMNVLLGEERAIVTEIAGTTRDTLEEQVRFGEISLNVIDTAGIRDTEDEVEKIGVSRAKNALNDADLILYVVDASSPLDEDDRKIMDMICGRRAVVLLNKSDLEIKTDIDALKKEEKLAGKKIIQISAKEETGFEEFKNTVREMFYNREIDFNDEVMITNLRHKEALSDSLKSLQMVMNSIENGLPEDFYSIDLMSAYSSLGSIIGEEIGEDLVNEIFAKFCLGK